MLNKVLNEAKYSRKDQVKFFKGCLPQILLGPFLNTLHQICLMISTGSKHFHASFQFSQQTL